MAERFPLIANASTGQIQELPAGDVLNLTGNGMNISESLLSLMVPLLIFQEQILIQVQEEIY